MHLVFIKSNMMNCVLRRTFLTKPLLYHLTCASCQLSKRTLFYENVLKVTSYLKQREALEARLGSINKEKFLSRVTASINNGKQVFTDDLRTLLLLANNKELMDLAFKTTAVYKGQQQKQAFSSFFNYGHIVLQMLYCNQELDRAFQWFYDDQRAMVVPMCRNFPCFLLMCDMLYKAGRYEDIVTLASTFDEYFQKTNWMLDMAHLGALYHIGTNDALYQLQSKMNERTMEEVPMPGRALMFSGMLAYKLKEYDTMLEIIELPIFQSVINNNTGKGTNLKLLAYLEMDRVDDAVLSLKSILVNMSKSYPIIFPCVLEKMKERVANSDSVEMKASFNDIQRALIRGEFVRNYNIETHLNALIGIKEVRTAQKLLTSRGTYSFAFQDNKMYQPHR